MAVRVNARMQRKRERLSGQWPLVDDGVFASLGVTRAQLRELELSVLGRIVLPGMPDYDAGRQRDGLCPFVSLPQMIVYCVVPNDVGLCLAWGHAHKWWVTCRSGGHSTAGYSVNTGVVIDVSGISYVSVDPRLKLARVGAGTQFHELNSVLSTYGLHVPGGTCPDVGVAGYMQGGGYGLTSLLFGMNCDNVESVTVMLADGRLVVAGSTTNADLFWAIRGGTGDNFGVLLEITYRLHELGELWGFCLQWPLDQAPPALTELQNGYTRDAVPQHLAYEAALLFSDGRPALAMIGMYAGRREAGLEALAPLRQTGDPELRADRYGTYEQLNTALFEILPELPPGRFKEVKQGGYISVPPQTTDWQLVARYFATAPNPYNMTDIEPYGGAISRQAAGANAFIHREPSMNFFIDSFYEGAAGETAEAGAQAWLDGFVQVLRPHFNGQMYQNYPVPQYADYRWAYWGDAFSSLLFVKQKYDPENLFHFEQSIAPYPDHDAGSLRRSTVPSMFSEPAITYVDGF